MQFYGDKVRIPVFGKSASVTPWTVRQDYVDNVKGVYYSDEKWLTGATDFTGSDISAGYNPVRDKGVIEGIARSSDYNTVLRQCSVFASLLAQILAYRNSSARTISNSSFVPYDKGLGTKTLIGTDLQGDEDSIYSHIGGLSDIFSKETFLFDDEVVTRTILDSAVTSAKIASKAVDNSKLADECISIRNLGTGLISVPASEANGIRVSLSQNNTSNSRGFVISVTCPNNDGKVTNAVNADYAENATYVKVVPAPSSQGNPPSTFYLCGPVALPNPSNKEQALFNSASVYVSNGNQLNASYFNVPSDRSLKKNIRNIGKHQVRELVEGVDVKCFDYKNSAEGSTIGVIAQDIQAVNAVLGDLLVFTDAETGKLGVHESKLVYVLWDYVKQQNEVIKKLSDKVAQLEKRVK